MSKDQFEEWALVELFGHQRIVGKVGESTVGGCSFLRVDVPERNGKQAFTKFYGNGAVYSMTPISEEAARAMLGGMDESPVHVWTPRVELIDGPKAVEEPDPCAACDHRDYEHDEQGVCQIVGCDCDGIPI